MVIRRSTASIAGGRLRIGVVRQVSTAVAVLAIVGASAIGLHDWADGATTHGTGPNRATSGDVAAR
jgi:hypothetical protein